MFHVCLKLKTKRKTENRPWRKTMTENQNITTELLQIEELEAKIAPDSGAWDPGA
jgi:hypothetical protein